MIQANNRTSYQRGSVLVEAVIALPVFFFILFGIVEYGYAYRAKATLNLATFEAVRAGALNNARLAPIERALAKGMAPQYMKGNTGILSFQEALIKVELFLAAMDALPGLDSVNIVAPTNSTFQEFKERVSVQLAGESEPRMRDIIPNDNLYWRDPELETVTINGEEMEITLQDANILKIKTLWCHRLITPGLDRLVSLAILNPPGFFSNVSEEQRVCNRLSLADGLVGRRNYYVAITSHSVMRMQSPVFSEGQLP